MDEKETVERSVRLGRKRGSHSNRYSFDEKLRAVKLHIEEGFQGKLVSAETGVSTSSLSLWVRAFRKEGEMGLRQESSPRPGRRLLRPVVEKIIEMKRGNPWYGVKRIADGLRRWFFLEASAETVRKTLHEADLMDARAKARRNLVRPRHFERATPNQMWQTDIFTFKLGGKYAYAVAFLDDYSRYVVNLELYRSPTAECVVETYRVAMGEYQPPKEMLTDRGPQYYNWRGTSRFASEMAKDRVKHLVSRPQHPMTLGKVERFWATMWQEFLVRAQFDSFESARERLKLWVKYYNHRRPHQGIGGLCPADRFFEIQGEMKKLIQAGIQENLLEMALRGQPKAPFYLVGRMEGQSVVLKAEKGKLKLSVDDKEMTYELEKGTNGNGQNEAQAHAQRAELAHGLGEGAGGPGDMDGAGEDSGGDEDPPGAVHYAPAVAGTGDGGDAAGPGASGEPGGRCGLEPTDPFAPRQEAAAGGKGEPEEAPPAVAGGCPGGETSLRSVNYGDGREGACAHRDDPEGALRADDGEGGGGGARGLAQDLLQVGEEGAAGDAGGRTGRPGGAALEGGGRGGEGAPAKGEVPLGEAGGDGADGGAAAHAPAPGAPGR
jgi:transposase InsO family protein/transposase-like protein